jgi:DNA-binding response OmpR family regulator
MSQLTHAPQETAPGQFPARMRVLWVTDCAASGRWLATTLADESSCEWELRAAHNHAAGLALLRSEHIDAVLVQHQAGVLDGVEFAAACRGGGYEEPLLVLGGESPLELEAAACDAGADAYVALEFAGLRSLVWTLSRAWERFQLQREIRRLRQNEQQRTQWERAEAERMLAEQRNLLETLDARDAGGHHPSLAAYASAELENDEGIDPSVATVLKPMRRGPTTNAMPSARGQARVTPPPQQAEREPLPSAALQQQYRDLLRTTVIMGSGKLQSELRELATELITARISARQTMLLHLQVVEELVRGLGQRSARHLLTRADLLILELTIALADGYRG